MKACRIQALIWEPTIDPFTLQDGKICPWFISEGDMFWFWPFLGSLLWYPMHCKTYGIVADEGKHGALASTWEHFWNLYIPICPNLTLMMVCSLTPVRRGSCLGAHRNITSVSSHGGIGVVLCFVPKYNKVGNLLMPDGAFILSIMITSSIWQRNFIVGQFCSWEHLYQQFFGHEIIFRAVQLRHSGALLFSSKSVMLGIFIAAHFPTPADTLSFAWLNLVYLPCSDLRQSSFWRQHKLWGCSLQLYIMYI